MAAETGAADDQTARLFWGLAALRFATWWLLPQWLARTLPLDVIEGLAWGREWQWGYWKHPPLAAAVLEGTTALFGRGPAAVWALGPLSVTLALWAVWRFARRRLPAWSALVAVLALDGVYYYGYASVKLNPDVLQLPLWALLVLGLDRALASQRRRDWLLCGVAAGVGILAKYYALVLALPLLLLLAMSAEARRVWRGPGPWLALGAALIVIAPHLWWLVGVDFAPLAYASARAVASPGIAERLAQPILFVAVQALVLLPLVAFLLALGWRPRWRGPGADLGARLLVVAVVGPVILTLVAALVFGVSLSGASRENWGTPLWSFAGVLLVSWGRPPAASPRRLLAAWLILLLLGAAAYAGRVGFAPALGRAPDRVRFPGAVLAERVEAAWRQNQGGPLPFVGGNVWLAGNIAYHSPTRPSVYVDLRGDRAPWIDEDELRRRGAVFVWDPRIEEAWYRETLASRFPQAEVRASLRLELGEIDGPVTVLVGWALLPPAPP